MMLFEKSTRFVSAQFGKIFLLTYFVFATQQSFAQQRSADSIFTIRKDTLVVKIAEVGINSIKYRKTPDSEIIHELLKTDILSIVYGNGEVETFGYSQYYKEKPSIQVTDKRYYKMVLATPFQKEIVRWPREKLLTERTHLKEKKDLNLTLGILSILGGTAMFIGGVSKLFDNTNSALALMDGGITVGTFSIPLFAFRARNGKKINFINAEIERRTTSH